MPCEICGATGTALADCVKCGQTICIDKCAGWFIFRHSDNERVPHAQRSCKPCGTDGVCVTLRKW